MDGLFDAVEGLVGGRIQPTNPINVCGDFQQVCSQTVPRENFDLRTGNHEMQRAGNEINRTQQTVQRAERALESGDVRNIMREGDRVMQQVDRIGGLFKR